MYHLNNLTAPLRLYRELKVHGKLLVAVDFDSTIYDYHEEGVDYSHTVELVKRAISLGHEVYIFTANVDHDLVRQYCVEVGLGELQINTNSLEHLFPSRKPFYNILLDDRAGLAMTIEHLTSILDAQEKKGLLYSIAENARSIRDETYYKNQQVI